MGAYLARLEVKIALQAWWRIRDVSLKPGAEIICRPGGVTGPEMLPPAWWGGADNFFIAAARHDD